MEINLYSLKKSSGKKFFSKMSSRLMILLVSVCLFLTFAGFGCGSYWDLLTHGFNSYEEFYSIFKKSMIFPTIYPETLNVLQEGFDGIAGGNARIKKKGVPLMQRPKRKYTTAEDIRFYSEFILMVKANPETECPEPYFSKLYLTKCRPETGQTFDPDDNDVYKNTKELENTTFYYSIHDLAEYEQELQLTRHFMPSEYDGYILISAFFLESRLYELELTLRGNKDPQYPDMVLEMAVLVDESMKPQE